MGTERTNERKNEEEEVSANGGFGMPAGMFRKRARVFWFLHMKGGMHKVPKGKKDNMRFVLATVSDRWVIYTL